jgi:hypothetical protein
VTAHVAQCGKQGQLVLTWRAMEIWPHVDADGSVVWRYGASVQSVCKNWQAAQSFARRMGWEIKL